MNNTNTPFNKDWFSVGFATGAAASTAKTAVNYLLDKAGLPTKYYGSVASSLVLGKRARFWGLMPSKTRGFGEWAIGYVADTLFGGLMGAGLTYVTAVKTPRGRELFKGVVGGASMWAITLSLGNLLRLDGLTRSKPGEMATMLGTAVIFGGLEGFVLGKYATQLVEQSHPILTKNISDKAFDAGSMAVGNRNASSACYRYQ